MLRNRITRPLLLLYVFMSLDSEGVSGLQNKTDYDDDKLIIPIVQRDGILLLVLGQYPETPIRIKAPLCRLCKHTGRDSPFPKELILVEFLPKAKSILHKSFSFSSATLCQPPSLLTQIARLCLLHLSQASPGGNEARHHDGRSSVLP